MSKFLLDYFFQVTSIEPTPQASTAFLKQVCIVVTPKAATPPGVVVLCTTPVQIAALTDNAEALQLLAGGLSRVYVLPATDLDLAAELAAQASNFFTLIISSDFNDAAVTGANFGTFKGVICVSSVNNAFLATQAAITHRVAFHTTVANKAKNLCFALGKLLSNSLAWRNQQYVTMPLADDVDTLGEANALFDSKISFVLSDDEFGNRLALFAAGGKAIVEPYITKNLEIDIQSAGLSYVSGNQPGYTLKQAALLEDELKKVVQAYIEREEIEAGSVEVKLEADNFVASSYMNIAEPKALWRIFGEMRQTL